MDPLCCESTSIYLEFFLSRKKKKIMEFGNLYSVQLKEKRIQQRTVCITKESRAMCFLNPHHLSEHFSYPWQLRSQSIKNTGSAWISHMTSYLMDLVFSSINWNYSYLPLGFHFERIVMPLCGCRHTKYNDICILLVFTTFTF